MSFNNDELKDLEFTGVLEKDVALFKSIFKKDAVLRIKSISPGEGKPDFALIYIDGMVDSLQLNEAVIKPLLLSPIPDTQRRLAEAVATGVLYARDAKLSPTPQKAIEGMLYGEAVLLIDKSSVALNIDAKGFRTRGINEPQDERVLQGPREGFEEAALLNLAMLRRKLQTPDLCIEMQRLGRRTSTMVFICYLGSLADPQLIKELHRRLAKIDIDGVLDSNYIAEQIRDNPYSLFKTTGSTERPDTVAARLLEGRVALLVDGTPFVLTVPYLFSENFQSDEDYYLNFLVSSIGRLLRYLCFLISVALPALFVALATFHQDLLPTTLAIASAGLRGGVPFSPLAECLVLIFIFEILKETGIRMPQSLGHALSIVGGLVVGQAAVDARIVSAPMLIVIAMSGISGLMIPRLKGAVFYLRLLLVIAAALWGFLGLISGLSILLIHILSLNSFGADYTASLKEANLQGLKDSVFRLPWPYMKTRPPFNFNKVRQVTPRGEDR